MGQLRVTDSATGQSGAIYYEYHRNDSGRPVIVLAHGWGMSTRAWDDTTAWLTDSGWPVLAFDQRNCGQSDKDFSDASVEALASDLVALIDELAISACVLNGWSLGGAVAMEATTALGDRLKGFISTCGATPRYTQADGFPYGGTAEDVAGTVAALRADRVNFLLGLYSEGAFSMPVSDAIKNWAHGIATGASPAADASLGALATTDQRATLSALQAPALFITGTADGVVDPAIGEYAAGQCANGRVVALEGCGHTPFIEDPAAYRSAVHAFLDAL